MEKMLTAEEAADILGLRVSTIRRWILDRRIGYTKISKNVRIPLSECEKILREGYRPAIPTGDER